MTVTRRSLLGNMAKLGGAGAVAETLAVWDFLKPPPALAASLALPKESGRGKTVAILGAGVSGLCAAYELDRAGYECVILEAQRRAGGRSLTLRRGDTFQEMNQPAQSVDFDEGLYLNAGPGRIPHHHVNVIDYCRRFNVTLQPYIFASRANLVHSSTLGNGRTVPVREALYSLQGHVAELLDRCHAKGALDLPVSGEDLAKLQEMLVQFGDLTSVPGKGYSYQNQSGRAGLERPAGVATPPKPITPMKLEEILRSRLWDDWIFRDADIYWQTSLLEPVGGMDQFFKGFLRQPLARQSGTIEGLIRYGAKVTGIDIAADKVTVRTDEPGGARTLQADYCVCTIPMPVFARLKTNLPPAYMTAARTRLRWRLARSAGRPSASGKPRRRSTAASRGPPIRSTRSGIRRPAISAPGARSPALTCAAPVRSPSTSGRLPSGSRSRASRASGCIPATRNMSSTASRSVGRTWSSRAAAGSTRTIRTSARTARSSRARRAASIWRATS